MNHGPCEIHYRIPGRAGGARPGAHPGRHAGSGEVFAGVADFFHRPDARRLELRRSVLDPFRRLRVRVFEQPGAVDVVLAADLSASMGADANKPRQVAWLIRALAAGARRLGDRFGFIGFDRRIRRDWTMPPTVATGWAPEWAARLGTTVWEGVGAEGGLALAEWLPARPALVVLVSDFHWPEALLRRVLSRLGRHWVMPVVLWSGGETEDWPDWGIRRVSDAESGRERLVWLRAGWRRRLRRRYEARRRSLQSVLMAAGAKPLWLGDDIDPLVVSRHFQEWAV